MTLRHSLAALAALSSFALSPFMAHADLPAPRGDKYVSFAFAVEGVGALADVVLLAYPTSQSDGAPTAELSVLSDGLPIELGRRSPQPKLYVIRRADFDAWRAANPTPPREFDDPTVQALLGKAVTCDLEPTPSFSLPESDPREQILEVLIAKKVDATVCELEPKGGATTSPATDGAPPPTGEPQTPRAKGGCASCAVDDGGATWLGLGSFVLALGLFMRRRRGPFGVGR
jgi:MYXO-CTERM domain-containing protein